MRTADKVSQYDKMTKTPVTNLIIRLSVPTILTMLVSNIYNMVDTMFVGKLGTSQSGAVGVIFGYMAVLQAVGFLFGQGSGSILSRQLGSKDNEEATKSASTGFFGALIVSIIVAAISYRRLDDVINILGCTDTIAPYAKIYIGYIIKSAPFIVTSFTMNNILRYEGKAFLGTIGMISGAVLNMIGDPIFMFGFDMKIAGAGLSTALAQFISFAILLTIFLTGHTQTKLSFKAFLGNLRNIPDVLATGLPSLLRQSLNSLSTIVLNLVARPYGDAAIAGMSIVSRISFFVFSVALGIGQGFQPVSAFNFGAKKYDRVKEAFKKALIMSEIVVIVMAAAVMMNVDGLILLFRDDIKVVEVGERALILQLLGQAFLPLGMMVEMLLQTTGNRAKASLLSSARSGLFLIPLLFILSYFRGLSGIQEAQPIATTITFIPAFFMQRTFFRKMDKAKEQ